MIPAVARVAAQAAGTRAARATPVAGGDVNRALRVELDDGGALFVKYRPDPPAGMYRAEARSLQWLAGAGALRVPEVVWTGEEGLALEWITPARPAADHDERLGRGLAALHLAGAPAFGCERDGFIATLPLPNAPLPTWAEFYGARRLEPLVRMGVDAGVLDAGCGPLLDRLRTRLPGLLGPEEAPARVHGDLWSGNVMTDERGGPVVMDPAAHGGHRETDLAMMRLFGGFSARVFAAYDEVHPPAPGREERVALHQLHPLLVHAVLFGGSYADRVRRVLAGAA